MQGQKRIEKYQFSLRKILGQGSYAKVYLGKVIDTGESVAVKVIEKIVFANTYNVKNIQSQIDILKRVSHENIVNLHDIYQTANNMYIVTEYCPQGDLLKMLTRSLTEPHARSLLRDILHGATYLHNHGIIHRDLKPANILLKNGRCKITDFGFAKSFDIEDDVMRSIVGTPLYMSPQILQKQKYTTKSDLWSIGLIYYEMLHGRTPWPANNELQLLNGILHKKILFAQDISQRSKDFIRRCLQVQEDRRISWEEATEHRLFNMVPRPFLDEQNHNSANNPHTPKALKSKYDIDYALKRNDNTNKKNDKSMRTQNDISSKKEKVDIFLKREKTDISNRKIKKLQQCLTPKNRLTPKNKNDVSYTKSGRRLNLLTKKINDEN